MKEFHTATLVRPQSPGLRDVPSLRYGLDPRRHLPHGVGPSLSRRGAGPSRRPSTASGSTARRSRTAQFRKFVNATGHVTFAEIPPEPKDYPGALPHMLKAGSLVFTPPKHPVDLRDWSQWWTFQVRRQLAASLWAGQLDQRARRPSGRARRLPRRRGLREMGRQGFADRGRVGVCGARRPRRRRIRVGRRIHAGRPARWPTPGRAHSRIENLADRRLRAHLAGDGVPAERLWPLRHDRQCLGMDHRLVLTRHTRPTRRRPAASRRTRAAAARTRATIRASPTSGFRARC